MMLLKLVEIDNFGPYYGKHELEMKGESDELVLVHGENMAGKTSLLNAVRWCLYGKTKDRTGVATPTLRLINSHAYSAGTRRVSVTLTVIDRDPDGDTEIRLRRQRQGKKGVATPTTDRDFDEYLEVDVGGDLLPEDQFDDQVNGLLPEEISRFFLFDGELLKEYEELVREDSGTHAREVKRAIEMILGVPAAQNGKRDLEELGAKAARAYNREAKKHKDIEESAQAADRLQDEVELLADEVKTLEEQRDEATRNLTKVREDLEKHEHLAENARSLGRIESRISDLESARKDKEQRRRDLAKDLWRDMLEPRLGHEIAKLERDRDGIGTALREKSVLSQERDKQQTALAGEQCASCGQSIPEDRKMKARVALADIQDKLDQLEGMADESGHDALGATIKRMRDVAPAGVASGIVEIEADLAKNDTERVKLNRQREGVEEDLRGFDPEVVRKHEREKEGLIGLIARLEDAIRRGTETLGHKRVELRDHQKKMRALDEPTLKQLRIERDLFQGAGAVFEASISDLTDELRSEVETQASEIFMSLTTDQSYAGLRINENYGLSIVAKTGDVVPVRSAGAEQIVALSLIGALNRLAAKRGPVIMDTPFGRLDRSHRENIMRFVPTLADQVALLVHSGEIDPERDLEPVKGKISAEWVIEHIESTKSELRRGAP